MMRLEETLLHYYQHLSNLIYYVILSGAKNLQRDGRDPHLHCVRRKCRSRKNAPSG